MRRFAGYLIIACVLPIVLAIYVVRSMGQHTNDDGLAELLVEELTREVPMMMLKPVMRAAPEDNGHPALPNSEQPNAS